MVLHAIHCSPATVIARASARGLGPAPLILLTGVVSLVLGQLTAVGQGSLPDQLASLANSSGPWILVTFLLALLARGPAVAAGAGSVSLGLLLAGYVLADWARGYPSSHAMIAFWALAALLAGPVIGLAGYGARRAGRTAAAWSVGVVPGLLAGEGLYGVTVVSATTSPVYWWAEMGAGLAVLVGLVGARKLAAVETLLSLGAAAATAAVFVLAYSADLITAFS